MLNWRNPDDYAYTKRLRLHAWAWEFLRRNPAYQVAWERYTTAHEAFLLSLRTTGRRSEELAAEDGEAFIAACHPFELSEPLDPGLTALELEYLSWRKAAGVSVLEEWQYHSRNRLWPGYPTQIALGFDFTLPIEPQVEHARELLQRCENTLKRDGYPWKDYKPTVRASRDRFLRALRLLDAAQAGASIGEMGRVLFKGNADARKSAGAALKQAKKLTEEGYKDLLMRANRGFSKKGEGSDFA